MIPLISGVIDYVAIVTKLDHARDPWKAARGQGEDLHGGGSGSLPPSLPAFSGERNSICWRKVPLVSPRPFVLEIRIQRPSREVMS